MGGLLIESSNRLAVCPIEHKDKWSAPACSSN